MIATIRDKISKIKKAAGLEIILLPDQKYSVNFVELVLEKKVIRIGKKQQLKETSLESLKQFLEKDTAVYINLSGRGILHKKLTEFSDDQNSLIQSVLPNAKAQDFYIQQIVSDKTNLVSVVRKETVDPLIKTINEMGFHAIGFSLGGTSIGSVLSLLSLGNASSFSWAGHSIECNPEGEITSYKIREDKDEKKYLQLDSEKLEEEYLIAYAGAFNILLNLAPVVPFIDTIQHQKEEFNQKLFFTKAGWAVLGFFMTVLLINFVLYSSYSSQNNELAQKESKYSSMFSEIEKLEKEVKEKEKFLSEAGWLQSSSMTYYADRIAATVPGSVKLTELSINPMDERKSKEEKKELFKTGIIHIKGECTRPTELNEWLDKIKSIDRISKARLVHYSFDDKENKGNFSIEIES